MNGAGLFKLICDDLGLKQSFYPVVANCIYTYIDDYIIPQLLKGGSIYLPKLGYLSIKKMKSRTSYDVLSRSIKNIPARKGIKFNASNKLKDAINEDTGYKSSNKSVTLDVIFGIAEKFELDIMLVANIFKSWGNAAYILFLHKERLVIPKVGTLYISNHSAKQVMDIIRNKKMYMQERAVVNIKVNKDLRKKLN